MAIEAELQKVGSEEEKRVGCLQEQAACNPDYLCENYETPSTCGRGKEFQHDEGVLEIQGEGAHCVCQRCKPESSLLKNPKAGLLRCAVPCNNDQTRTPFILLGLFGVREKRGFPAPDGFVSLHPTENPPLGEGEIKNASLEKIPPTPLSWIIRGVGKLNVYRHLTGYRPTENPLYKGGKKAAFTLAEVLITLGIIGVVAAMTMPALLNKTQSKELETQFKKVYSELNQVAQMFKKDNEISVPEYASSTGTGSTMKLLLKYYKGAKMIDDTTFNSKDEAGHVKSAKYNIYTMNGTKLLMGPCDDAGFYSENGGRIYSFVLDKVAQGEDGPVVCVDVNGHKGPNKYGYDIHIFYFTTDGFAYPMGQPHKNSSNKHAVGDHSSDNFFVTGTSYCKSSSSVSDQAACAYYAMQNENPQGNGNYWQDFLGKNR